MRVLFLMISYPDVTVNSNMYTNLAQKFSIEGNDVYVAVSNGPHKTFLRTEGNVKVLRVRTLEMFNTSFIKKGIANILLGYQVAKAISKYFSNVKFDAVIVPTPPITYLDTIKRIKKAYNLKVYLILRDIFPQNAIDLGILKNRILYKYFRKKEKQIYSVVDHIGCMSERNMSYIGNNNPEIPHSKIHLLPNWKNVHEYTKPDLSLKKKYGLENKFIALYGGNFGKPQQLEFLLELASALINIEDVKFLFIGEGTEKQKMLKIVAEANLRNVMIMDLLPQSTYQEFVKICDLGLVNLSSRFTIPNIPSRTLSYWEAKLPVLAAIDTATDLSTILEQSGSGLWSVTGELDSYINNFMKLYSNKELRITMGNNGYKYLLENCTTSCAYSIISSKILNGNKISGDI